MKYQILVPPPKASRMKNNCKLFLTYHHGWEPDREIEFSLQDAGTFQFEVNDEYEWIYDTSTIDGDTFSVRIEYQNDKKTRKEVVHPVPEKLKKGD